MRRSPPLGQAVNAARLSGQDHRAQFVKPFIKSNKNDANNAQAICEAMGRPSLHPVRVKTVEQQDFQAMHRIRDEIKSHRIAKANQIRGLVTEYGLVAPQQLAALRRAIPDWLEDADNRLSRWIIDLQSRRHANVVAVALANKMARMAWAMMTREVDYDPDLAAASIS